MREENISMNANKLFDHQKEGILFLKKHRGVILADEMGLGKTRQAAIAARELSDEIILVVCPASPKITWKSEIGIVYPEEEVVIISGGDVKKAQKGITPQTKWIIINYDILSKHYEWLSTVTDISIFDEAHYAKDIKAIRTQAMLALASTMKRVYLLTGTPVINRPIEMFSLLRAIKHPLAWSETKSISALKRNYSTRYCDGHLRVIHIRGGRTLRFWDDSGATRLSELRELTRGVFLRRTKKEVLNLPPKIISVVQTTLTTEQQKNYDTAWEQYLDFVQANPLKKDIEGLLLARGLVELTKLKQICSLSKIERVVSDVENMIQQENKVIIFSQYTQTIRELKIGLTAKKIKSVTLMGENTGKERQEAIESFQNNLKTKVFIANIKAGGVGINLTAATHVIFIDMDWSPETHHQAEDRAHRIGQTGTVNVYYYVVENTIEEDIIAILNEKQETIGALTGGKTSTKVFVDLMVKRLGITQ